MKDIVKIIKYTALGILLYMLITGVIFNHIIPVSPPNFHEFKTAHPFLRSEEEGFLIEPITCELEQMRADITINAFASGPPLHVHETFDEYFEVKRGKLSLIVDGKKRFLEAGEHIWIKKGTPHKPFNEQSEPVILQSDVPVMPYSFAYGLSKLYPVMDRHGVNSPKVLFQLCKLGNNMDTWLADKPIAIQKLLRWVIGPTARIFNL